MRPTVEIECTPQYECLDCGARVVDPDRPVCPDCGGPLQNLSVPRDL